MKRLNKLYIVLVFLVCGDTLYSQTVTWQRQSSWDAVEIFGDHLLKVEQSGKWGLADFDGVEVIPCNYVCLTEIHEERFLVIGENNKLLSLGYPSGRVVHVNGEWYVDDVWPYFTNGLLAVRNSQNLWGYMDKSGKVVIKERYTNAFPFFFGFASVCENNEKGWHIINTKGNCLTVDGEKNFSFASSYTKIDERRPLAMVLISDKLYFIDINGNTTGDIVPDKGATVSGFESEKRFVCGEGNSRMEVEVGAVVEIVSITKGNVDYQCHKNSVETISFPQVRGIDIENDGTIKVGELVILPQFQEVVALTSERVLVKNDEKWSLLKFDLDESPIRVILNESLTQEICHNTPMFFQLIGKRENVRVYTVDEEGNMAFLDVDSTTGSFHALMNYLNKNEEAEFIIGLQTDDVVLAPKVFAEKVSLGDGFMVSGPEKVIVSKRKGKTSTEITIWNHSDQDAAPFDVSVDNGINMHFDGLPSHRFITIPVGKNYEISPLNDDVLKSIKVKISEIGMPEREYKVNIKFAIKTIDG